MAQRVLKRLLLIKSISLNYVLSVFLQTEHCYFLLHVMKRLYLILFIALTHVSIHAESDHDILYDWQNYTYKSTGRITHNQSQIILSSNSGLIFIDKETGEQKTLNRVSGLTDNHVSFVKIIDDELWYGGLRNGFGVIKDGQINNFTRSGYPINHDAYINAIEKDKAGRLYVSSGSDMMIFKDGKYDITYTFPYDPFSNYQEITAICADKDGNIWIGGYDTVGNEGVCILTENGIEIIYKNLGGVRKILSTSDGSLWMLAKHGLLKYDGTTFHEILTDTEGQEFYNMSDMAIAEDGKIWLVSGKLLMSFDGKNIAKYQYESEYTSPLGFVDIDGDYVYVTALYSKLLKFRNGTFETITLDYGKLSVENMSKAGSLDHEGNYLAGTINCGLLKFRPDGTFTKLEAIKNNCVSKTITDRNGDIWVACNRTSPFRLFKITPTDTITYSLNGSSPLKGGEDIFQMAVDQHNKLWIASSNGLHCFDGNNWQTFDKKNSGLTTNRVYCIAFDRNGHLWTCCGKNLTDYLELGDGLFCYDGKVWTHYISSHDVRRATEGWVGPTIPIPTNSIGRIAFDDNNTFWIACNVNEVYSTADIDDWHGGLIHWDGKDHWQRFMSRNDETPDSIASDLPGNWVNSIEFDRYGRVWLGFEGDHGIAMYDGKEFTIWDMDVPGIAYGNIQNLVVDRSNDRIWASHPWGASGAGVSTARIRNGSTTDIKPQNSPFGLQQMYERIFDLRGRQIQQPKHGEPFIKNGRKYIKR